MNDVNVYRPMELLKAKKMAIGTVSHGRKKVAEGKWVEIREGLSKKVDPIFDKLPTYWGNGHNSKELALSLIQEKMKLPVDVLKKRTALLLKHSKSGKVPVGMQDKIQVAWAVYGSALKLKSKGGKPAKYDLRNEAELIRDSFQGDGYDERQLSNDERLWGDEVENDNIG